MCIIEKTYVSKAGKTEKIWKRARETVVHRCVWVKIEYLCDRG